MLMSSRIRFHFSQSVDALMNAHTSQQTSQRIPEAKQCFAKSVVNPTGHLCQVTLKDCTAILNRTHWQQYQLIAVSTVVIFCLFPSQCLSLPGKWFYFLSWTTLGCLGVTLGYHRYFSHRQFSATLPLQIALGWMASICWQGSVKTWAIQHHLHHQFADTENDIHSPINFKTKTRITGSSFIHAHHQWMKTIGFNLNKSLRHNDLIQTRKRYQRRIQLLIGLTTPAKPKSSPSTTQHINTQGERIKPAPTIDQQLDNCYAIFWITSILAPLCLAVIIAAFSDGGLSAEHVMKHLASAFFWGTLIRILACQEMANINNSFGHWIGYRSHATQDNSRNNLLTGWLMFGEGFHNNHHHAPNAWNMGQQWYEVDLGASILRLLFAFKLASPRHSPVRKTSMSAGQV